MKKYKIKLNDKVYEVEVEEIEDDQNIENSINEIQDSKPKQEESSIANDGIKAPMPGKIVSIQVKEGEIVKKGQVVCILEAMKMENEIVSPSNGKISSISISQGQNVSAGESLVSIR
ncbi:MAG: acetyl-CoA carboxylase biotin carboxyl carrier protein subunit [Tepidibacter sp.]|jgi:biotin carboxyl carrier protein|uniref:acetyl-CoA carboxylase biotin carboxyl carrier protein subunit n=1 Tax=Tepidibacter sp. TaxID=2529387 RepID=UPI0025F7C714|nr:acetyl-CoA carboxylase biotin carboxyl carrier protein subunit [Tepidibacter sp.]MCT4508029.1 acetyl-CoA carboxylase biotin carboxyl carrier protein subunit [Tepidibacter sp.]